MPKSSRLSSGSRSARWITAVPFDWSPSAIARAREPRAVVRDEGDVRDAADANEPRLRAAVADPFADRLEHVAVARGR